MHGGRVWVEDRLDGEPGARFVIELLAVEAASRRRTGRPRTDGVRRAAARRSAIAVAARRACAIQPDTGAAGHPGRRPRAARPGRPGRRRADGDEPGLPRSPSDDDDGERLLRSVLAQRRPPTPRRCSRRCSTGPTQRGARGRLPHRPARRRSTLISARSVAGTLNVDVSPEILELPRPGSCTSPSPRSCSPPASSPGVEQVRLRVDGEPQAWPDGAASCRPTPLTVYDYPGLVESAQTALPRRPQSAVERSPSAERRQSVGARAR